MKHRNQHKFEEKQNSPALANVLIVFQKQATLEVFVHVVVTPCRNSSIVFAMLRRMSFFQNVVGNVLRNGLAANAVVSLGHGFRASDALGGAKRRFTVAGAPAVVGSS